MKKLETKCPTHGCNLVEIQGVAVCHKCFSEATPGIPIRHHKGEAAISKTDGSIQKAADRIIALEKQLSASTAALAETETKLREIREYASCNTDQWARDVYALASNPNHP